MSDIDRSAYSDLMVAYENKIGKMIIEEAEKMDLKKIEAYIVLENVLKIMKNKIKEEKNQRQ